MKLLIAEDLMVVQKILEKFLAPYIDIVFVKNGKEALDMYFRSLKINQPFKVIFLDLLMPIMSGYEVLKSIRQYEDEHNIPKEERVKIVVLSAVKDEDGVKKAIIAGCDGYILKPFSKERVFEELKKLGFDLLKEEEEEEKNATAKKVEPPAEEQAVEEKSGPPKTDSAGENQ